MFALGPSLREARLKRGLELDAVQKALRIRRRYLEALESERFELVPGEVYARGFLREYAEFLGLDGSLYVDEYNARFAHDDEVPITARPTAPKLRRSPKRPVLLSVLAALALAVGLAAWKFGGTPTPTPAVQAPAVPAAQTQRPATKKPSPAAAAAPKLAQLVLRAARGDCWVIVRAGSASGRVLYEHTLRQGSSLHLTVRRPLWLRVGAGLNLDASLGGRKLRVPQMTGNLLLKA
jgi:cytoskeleton protein RodZ